MPPGGWQQVYLQACPTAAIVCVIVRYTASVYHAAAPFSAQQYIKCESTFLQHHRYPGGGGSVLYAFDAVSELCHEQSKTFSTGVPHAWHSTLILFALTQSLLLYSLLIGELGGDDRGCHDPSTKNITSKVCKRCSSSGTTPRTCTRHSEAQQTHLPGVGEVVQGHEAGRCAPCS